MAHQSLYRRYRPKRFAELRGQDHVSRALRNAVTSDTVGHAYLFSGPRGTGKTSTARLLAKALNCTNLQDGEPCGVCESCVAMEAGSSYDLFELDAASNNRVETMRDLVSSAAVGSPGRRKVYILDEVHMLSSGASNTLLKTLEEPPDHVVFVLATTDPQKVLPTIRSRCQHFEFSLLSAEELEAYVRWPSADVGDDQGRTRRAPRPRATRTRSAGTGCDGRQHLVRIRGGQHEHDVVGRFLEGLRNVWPHPTRHVDLVEDVHHCADPVTPPPRSTRGRASSRLLLERSVELEQVVGRAGLHGDARLADAARLPGGSCS